MTIIWALSKHCMLLFSLWCQYYKLFVVCHLVPNWSFFLWNLHSYIIQEWKYFWFLDCKKNSKLSFERGLNVYQVYKESGMIVNFVLIRLFYLIVKLFVLISRTDLSLSQRVEYLSRAIVCAKGSTLMTSVTTEGEFLHELEEKMEVSTQVLWIISWR